jgi:protoporphyrinogen oxidase
MKVAVIGAGVAGLVAAHRLTGEGHVCDVYERWPGLGGQAATLDVGDGVLLERYYHHLFTSDRHISALYDELGMPDELEWRPSSVGVFADGRCHPFTTPLDLLRFSPLSPLARVRMGLAVLALQRFSRDVEPFESITARDWVRRAMGRQAWDKVWGPLLQGKFGDRAGDISMAWLWSKLTLRRQIKGREARQELLGYPRHSWELLFDALRASIEDRGGAVLIDRPVKRLARDAAGFRITPGAQQSFRRGHDPERFDALPDERYDAVVATVPSDVFLGLLDDELAAQLGADYTRRLDTAEYHTALCLLLELDRPFGRFYWTNIADPEVPFVGLIEHTNFIEPERYDGRRFLYVANYLAPGDPLLALDDEALLDVYEPALRRINPAFDRAWIRQRWLFREAAAQPIVTPGYRDKLPALRTPVQGLVVANTTQVYPEDRGTNYAVRLGDDAARELLASTPAPVPLPAAA